MAFQTGDIICVQNKSLFGKTIGWFSKRRNESETYATHIAMVKDVFTVTEAKLTIKESGISKWIDNHRNFEIYRYKHMEKYQRDKIYEYAEEQKGNIYGGWKLLFFAADLSIEKLIGKDIFLFRNVLSSENFPICSWFVGYAYYRAGIKFEKNNPKYLDPDVMHDIIYRDKDNWKLIFKKAKGKYIDI